MDAEELLLLLRLCVHVCACLLQKKPVKIIHQTRFFFFEVVVVDLKHILFMGCLVFEVAQYSTFFIFVTFAPC